MYNNILISIKRLLFNFIMLSVVMASFVFLLPCLLLPSNKIQGCFRPVLRFTFFLLKVFYGVELEVCGYEHVDALIKKNQNFIIAAKHQSTLDVYFILFLFNAPVFVLKKELLMIPFFGPYILLSKMITIDRRNGMASLKKILKKSKEVFAQNRPIVIFPEGKRVRPGENIEYKSGIVAVYNHLNASVIPIASNTAEVWSNGYFFKEAKSKLLKISILSPIEPGLKSDEFVDSLKNSIEGEMEKIYSSC